MRLERDTAHAEILILKSTHRYRRYCNNCVSVVKKSGSSSAKLSFSFSTEPSKKTRLKEKGIYEIKEDTQEILFTTKGVSYLNRYNLAGDSLTLEDSYKKNDSTEVKYVRSFKRRR